MKKYRNISIILVFLLLLTVGFTFKQNSDLKKVERALFGVGISSALIDYQTYSLANTLNYITEKKQLTTYQYGGSFIARDFLKLYNSYSDLHQYHSSMSSEDERVVTHLLEMLQDFRIFFEYFIITYEHEAVESNEEEGQHMIPLKDEAYEGSKIIATIMTDLENIRSEVYEDKPVDDREAWKELVIQNEEYAQTDKVQQDWERVQQIIKMWAN